MGKTFSFSFFFLRFYLFIFRQRGREGEREGEKSQCVVASHAPPTGDLAFNPGICPHWESNWQPFGSQACAHSTEPHLPGQKTSIFKALQRRRLLRDPGVIVATCSQVLIIHLSPVGAPHFPQYPEAGSSLCLFLSLCFASEQGAGLPAGSWTYLFLPPYLITALLF